MILRWLMVVAFAAVLASFFVSGFFGDPAQGRRALADLSPIEAEILADKFIDDDEAVLARETLKRCLREAGFSVHHQPPETDRNPGDVAFGFTDRPGDSTFDASAMDRKAEACESEINAAAAVWVLQAERLPWQPLPGLADALEDLDIESSSYIGGSR